MLMFSSRKARELLVITGGLFKSHYRYSNISVSDGAAAAEKVNLMVDYLIDSLQFSRKEAIYAASKSKVTHLKSTDNCDLVVNLFRDYGFDDTHIKNIVSYYPRILLCKPSKTLEPKIRFFQELGLPRSGLVKLVKRYPAVFQRGIRTQIIPTVEYLRNLLGSEEKVLKVISKSKYVFNSSSSSSFVERMSAVVSCLRNYGLSNEKICKGILRISHSLIPKPKEIQDKLRYVERKLGISRDSPNFIYGVDIVLCLSASNIEKKMQVFQIFGWSDSEVSKLMTVQPLCLTKSEANIHEKLDFFMKELGCTPSYLITVSSIFSWSLEKRVKPRYRFLKTLKEMKLVNDKPALITVLGYSELRFYRFFSASRVTYLGYVKVMRTM